MSLDVCVVGSLNMDLVAYASRRPERGETLIGHHFAMTTGGKGFNQAVASARAGASTAIVGRVGDDDFGRTFQNVLTTEGIDVSQLNNTAGVSTGVGLPVVESDGSNSIIIVPGANHVVTPSDVRTAGELIASAAVMLLQLELPIETVLTAAELAKSAGKTVILNPAPALLVPADLLSLADFFVPNEVEIATYAVGSSAADCVDDLAKRHHDLVIVVTCGADGVLVRQKNGDTIAIAAPTIDVVDTVGAGDVFCGYFAATLARGGTPLDAIEASVHAASISVTKRGAGMSAPYLAELNQRELAGDLD